MQDMPPFNAAYKLRQVLSTISTVASGAAKTASVLSGYGLVSKEIRDNRLRICQQCPGGHYNNGICGRLAQKTRQTCGCLMTTKTWLKSEQCPSGYWTKENDNA